MKIKFILSVCLAIFPHGGAATCPDLSLVLAIDSSSSIDVAEYNLQQSGYAFAFADPQVHRALAAAGIVDVAVVFWADADFDAQIIPWRRIEAGRDADALAAEIRYAPRKLFGDTNIGFGLQTALDLTDGPVHCKGRLVINVSGDGKETPNFSRRNMQHSSLAVARARAMQMDVTINALAITNEDIGLEEYYRDRLILGPDSFVMSNGGFETFRAAIIEKLEREINGPQIAALGAKTRRTTVATSALLQNVRFEH